MNDAAGYTPRVEAGLAKLEAIERAKQHAKRWQVKYCVFAVRLGQPEERWCAYHTVHTRKTAPSDVFVWPDGRVE
jgi:hypothetical protein